MTDGVYEKWRDFNAGLEYRLWAKLGESGVIQSNDENQNDTRASLIEYEELQAVPLDWIVIDPADVPELAEVWVESKKTELGATTADGVDIYSMPTSALTFKHALDYFALSYKQREYELLEDGDMVKRLTDEIGLNSGVAMNVIVSLLEKYDITPKKADQ